MIKRQIWFLSLLLLTSVSVYGQTTVTGHVVFPDSSAASNAKVCFSLGNYKPNSPRVLGTGTLVSQTSFCITPAADGSFSTSLYGNNLLNPTATNWRVDFLFNGIQSSSMTFIINHSPFNLDTESPVSGSTPAGPNQLVVSGFPFTQLAPATTWTIVHNLNDLNVQVYSTDINHHRIYPDTETETDPNTVVLTFISAQAGFASITHIGSINIATNQPNAVVQNPLGTQTIGGSLSVSGLTTTGPNALGGTTTLGTIKPIDITQGTSFTAFGDSYTACFGVVVPANCYVNQIAAAKGWALTNNGISGSGIADQMDSILGTTVTTGSISTILGFVNDMRNTGAGGITGAAQQLDQASSVEAGLLWLATPDSAKVKASDLTAVTYSGSWTVPISSYGGLMRQTVVPGATASFSVYGTSVDVVTLWQAINTSTYSISIDGVTQPTISTITGAYQTLQGRAFGPLINRFSGLAEVSHNVVVTCVSADASDPCYFVFATSGTGAATRTGPFVYLGNTLRFTTAGYSGNGGSDTLVNQMNQRLKQVATDLATDGLHVVLVDVSGYYTPNGTNTQGDGVHPTDAAHVNSIAPEFINVMSGIVLPGDRAAIQVIENTNPCTLNGIWAIGGCPSGSSRGDIGGAETAAVGKVYLGLDGAGIVRNGANYLLTAPTLNLLQFNGTSSSFPAFKFFGVPAKVAVRAADDSGDALLQASQFTSSVATGTAPFIVSSTTPVANLTVQNCTTCALTATTIGGGSTINAVYQGTATLTYTAIAAQTCQEQPFTLTGAATTGIASASPTTNLGNVSLSYGGARVSATNTVQVKVCNVTTGSLTPTAVSWNAMVTQ